MTMPAASDWPKAYARVQRLADADVMKLLRSGFRDLRIQIDAILAKPFPTVSDAVRIEQLRMIQRAMLRQQADMWARLGRIIEARRLDAAAEAIKLGSAIDQVLFAATGDEFTARNLKNSLLASSEATIEPTIFRITISALPLSQRIYQSNVWIDQRVHNMVNSALLRGLSAREFAKEAEAWFNPNVRGGTRYAAMRLARTEINNAFHATSIVNADDKPWINSMQWRLSGSHLKADACDVIAKGGAKGDGIYPPREVPRKPHPQCLCYVFPISPSEDDFLDALVSGKYDDYLDSKILKR